MEKRKTNTAEDLDGIYTHEKRLCQVVAYTNITGKSSLYCWIQYLDNKDIILIQYKFLIPSKNGKLLYGKK